MEIRTAPHYLKVKNRAILLVSVLTFFVSINSFSAGKCIDLITSIRTSQIETLGSLKSTFKHTNQYKVEVPHQSEIMNQCSLGTCHLHAWVSQLEQSYTAKTNKKIKISSHYLSLNHWVFKSLESLYSADTKLINVDLGASITQSARSIMMSGIIPDEAWVGTRDFSDAVISARLTEYIKNITAQAKWSAAREHTSEKKKSIIDAAAAEITNIFESLVGKQPEKFLYQGKEYTARSFMLEYFPNLLDSVVQLKVVSEKKTKNEAVSYGDDLDISTHTAEAVRVARQLIDQGKNVYLAYDHNSAFVDSKTGVMSISAFNLPDSAKPLLRSQRMYFNEYGSGHAVQIVGYDVDPVTNQVTRWKIKNSWGSEHGDLGYYHMYADYFNAFIRRIAFHKTASIELPKIDSVTPIQQTLF